MIEHYSHKIQNAIQKELFKANKSIKIAVAWFTNDLLFQPLLLKLSAGVTVEIVLNKDEINCSDENEFDFDAFVNAGGIIRWNTSKQLMHNKFCIIDNRVVITGSYNWTKLAEYHDENITIFHDEVSTIDFFNNSFRELAAQCGAENIGIRHTYEAKGYIDDEGFFIDEFGAKYSRDKKILIKGADIEKYMVDGQTEIIGKKAFYWYKHITEVIIPQSVKFIEEHAFFACENLNLIELTEGLVTIGDGAFTHCRCLKSIYIPKTVKSIGQGAFSGCKNLERVDISSLKSWCDIEFIGHNPLQCAHHLYINDFEIKYLEIPNGVNEIKNHAFHGASSIISVHLPNDLKSIGSYAFSECGFSEISIPEYVNNIGVGAFSKSKIKKLILPNSLQEIKEGTFEECKELSSIDIPGNVKRIGEAAFFRCVKLLTIIIKDGVTHIDDVAFYDCYRLESIIIPKSVIYIGYNAFHTFNLSVIKVDNDNRVYDSREKCNAIIETSTNKLICGCNTSTIPNTVAIIGREAFAGYENLVSINIPQSVILIEQDAFNSTGLSSIVIQFGVKEIDYNVFYGCKHLKSVIIKGKNTKFIESFGNCTSLECIKVPKGTKETYRNMLNDIEENVQFIEEDNVIKENMIPF